MPGWVLSGMSVTHWVSFSFDDCFVSASTLGADCLESHGLNATYYICPSLLNKRITGIDEKIMGPDDMLRLHKSGHEIGFHTRHHADLCRAGLLSTVREICQGQGISRIIGRKAVNFSYPFGECSRYLDLVFKSLGYKSTRGIAPGVNLPSARFSLRAVSVYESTYRPERIASILRESQAQGGWVIFYTHDVKTAPSRYGCTPSTLQTVIRMAFDTGAKVIPVRDVIDETRKKQRTG